MPEKDKRVPLKNLEKAEKSTSTEHPPEKKRKIDPDLAACVESKLLEIRKEIAVLDKVKSNGESSSKKKNKKNKNNQQNNAVSPQKETKPAEFDYGSVDFQKFRGGSIKEQPNVQFKSKFHGKVRRYEINRRIIELCVHNLSFFCFRVKITKQTNNSSNRYQFMLKRNDKNVVKSTFFFLFSFL